VPCFNLLHDSQGAASTASARLPTLLWGAVGGALRLPPRMSGRTVLKAPSVDECCEFTISVREAIAVAKGRQLWT
jgi:hypothetical protein